MSTHGRSTCITYTPIMSTRVTSTRVTSTRVMSTRVTSTHTRITSICICIMGTGIMSAHIMSARMSTRLSASIMSAVMSSATLHKSIMGEIRASWEKCSAMPFASFRIKPNERIKHISLWKTTSRLAQIHCSWSTDVPLGFLHDLNTSCR